MIEYKQVYTIGSNGETDMLFNATLFSLLPTDPSYTEYNRCILNAGTTAAVTKNRKNKGWFEFIQDSLLPLTERRDKLLTQYRSLIIGKGDTSATKFRLTLAQHHVDAIKSKGRMEKRSRSFRGRHKPS